MHFTLNDSAYLVEKTFISLFAWVLWIFPVVFVASTTSAQAASSPGEGVMRRAGSCAAEVYQDLHRQERLERMHWIGTDRAAPVNVAQALRANEEVTRTYASFARSELLSRSSSNEHPRFLWLTLAAFASEHVGEFLLEIARDHYPPSIIGRWRAMALPVYNERYINFLRQVDSPLQSAAYIRAVQGNQAVFWSQIWQHLLADRCGLPVLMNVLNAWKAEATHDELLGIALLTQAWPKIMGQWDRDEWLHGNLQLLEYEQTHVLQPLVYSGRLAFAGGYLVSSRATLNHGRERSLLTYLQWRRLHPDASRSLAHLPSRNNYVFGVMRDFQARLYGDWNATASELQDVIERLAINHGEMVRIREINH